ncbi:MAG: hypothetical protein KF723_10925 [Rhizobiaceae bacterium]|nr:hypothetical protein [Rhizobiaceae bacterium]
MQQLGLLALLIAGALIPYLVERFAYGIRFGLFAILFWLFVAQCALIAVLLVVAETLGAGSLAGNLAGIGAGLLLFVIGFIPFLALPVCLAVVLAMMGWTWLQGRTARPKPPHRDGHP